MCPTNPPNVPTHKKIKIKTGSHPLFSPLNPSFSNFMKNSERGDEIRTGTGLGAGLETTFTENFTWEKEEGKRLGGQEVYDHVSRR